MSRTSSSHATDAGAELLATLDDAVVTQWLRYADLISRRGYVSSQLGNIAVRAPSPIDPVHGVIYTKHGGVSIEEATRENLVVTDVPAQRLLYGRRMPSIGHKMNVEIFRQRPDVNAVVHLHVNEVLAYFTMTGQKSLSYISSDTALIMGKPSHVLDPEINVELDVSHLASFIATTNAFVMPNHGLTTLGADLSIAYNRMNAFVAEVRRLHGAVMLSAALERPVPYLSSAEVDALYAASSAILDGGVS